MSKHLSVIYYHENKEGLQKKARERYQNLSKEYKEKKRHNSREHYKNLSEEEKQNLVEYRKFHIIIITKYFNLENNNIDIIDINIYIYIYIYMYV